MALSQSLSPEKMEATPKSVPLHGTRELEYLSSHPISNWLRVAFWERRIGGRECGDCGIKFQSANSVLSASVRTMFTIF